MEFINKYSVLMMYSVSSAVVSLSFAASRHDVYVVGVVGVGGGRSSSRSHKDRVPAVHGAARGHHTVARHSGRHARLA